MTQQIRWGIVSTGRITHQFAQDFQFVRNGVLHAVSSRSQETADKFAAQYSIPRSYPNYAAMLEDDEVDAVYVATPHNNHFENTRDAIAAGKAVLCEKPFTTNVAECRELTRQATEAGIYVMEAMWTYFLPAIRTAQDWVSAGRIGEIVQIKADFGYPQAYDPKSRAYNPDLAGGVLLDMGIYPIALACLFLPDDPHNVEVVARKAPTGVDDDVTMIFEYPDCLANLSSSFRCKLPNCAYIIGREGYIAIPDFWRAQQCHLFQLDEHVDSHIDNRPSIGLNFEAIAVGEDLMAGRRQSEVVPWSATRRFQSLMARVFDEF
jgi:predicted dehydrogenase